MNENKQYSNWYIENKNRPGRKEITVLKLAPNNEYTLLYRNNGEKLYMVEDEIKLDDSGDDFQLLNYNQGDCYIDLQIYQDNIILRQFTKDKNIDSKIDRKYNGEFILPYISELLLNNYRKLTKNEKVTT